MFYGHGANCVYIKSDPERKREQERRDSLRRAASEAWHSKWITVWRLKHDRLWTDGMIKKLLGRPRKQGKYRVFSVQTVRQAESTPEFQVWLSPRLTKKVSKYPYFVINTLPEHPLKPPPRRRRR